MSELRRRIGSWLSVSGVTTDCTFTGPAGPVSLAGLFDGRRQLITYHFMWRHEQSGVPGEDQGCPAPYIRSGTDGPGVSVFLREDDRDFHREAGRRGQRPGGPAMSFALTGSHTGVV